MGLEGSLGDLIVSITTDMSTLNKGMKDAEKLIKDSTGKINEYTNKIGLTLTAVGAAITGTFALMIKSSVDFSDEIFKVNQQTGIAVETLSELKYVADQTESSFAAVSQGMKYLSRNIYEATNGNDKMNQSFRVLGISLKDEVTGKLLESEQVFLKIADKFKNLTDESAKTALAMEIFGKQGISMIPILNLGSDGIQKLSDEAHRLGVVLTADNAKAIDNFSDGMASLKSAAAGLWLNISLLLLPTLEKLVAMVTNVVVSVRKWSEEHPKLSQFISGTTLAIGAISLVLGPLILAFNQLVQALLNLKVLLPLITAQITALKGSLAILYPIALAVAAAFAGWKLGEWLESNSKKLQEFGLRVQDFFKNLGKPKTAVMEFGWSDSSFPKSGSTEAGTESNAAASSAVASNDTLTVLDEAVNKIDQQKQALKELNEEYLSGQITLQEYYDQQLEIHNDGIEAKQIELEIYQEGETAARNYYKVKAELSNQDLINQQNTLDSATRLLQTMQSMHKTIWQGIFDFINTGITAFSSGFSTAISSIILGTKTASEAFQDFGKMLITTIVNFIVEWGVQALVAMALGNMITALVTSQANTVAAAWLPAAVFASIATLGAADAAGTAGLAGALGTGTALFMGMKGLQAASSGGGLLTLGNGGIVEDPTLALIGEKGPEAVIPLNGRNGVGENFFGDININVQASIGSNMDIKDLAEELGVEIKRQLNYARGT